MSTLSAAEQLLLELVNRARLDPAGEAARFGIGLNSGISGAALTASAKQILAPNNLLNNSAEDHSSWMLAHDVFSHTGAGNSSPGERMEAAGYAFSGSWTRGENIAWQGTTGSFATAAYIADEHRSLFLSAGHRINLLNGDFREVGLGAVEGRFSSGGTNWNALMVTENFARSGTDVFLSGVVFEDSDRNDFYSVGEGQNGVRIAVDHPSSDAAGSTALAGGYAIAVEAGAIEVTFSGGGLAAPVSALLTMTGSNAKVDLVDGDMIQSSVDITLGSNAADLRLLGVAAIEGTGNELRNLLIGGTGANELSGAGGNDMLRGCLGRDTLTGGAGNDKFDFNATAESKRGSARDTITDFTAGDDRIDLAGIDASSRSSGNQAFRFIGTQGFHGRAGELHIVDSGTDVIVSGDVDGDRRADFEIKVSDVASLAGTDFVL